MRTVLVDSQVPSMNEWTDGSVLEGNAGGGIGLANKHTLYLIYLWAVHSAMWGPGEKTLEVTLELLLIFGIVGLQ